MITDSKTRQIGKVTGLDTYTCIVELLPNTKNFYTSGFDDIHHFGQINSFVLIPTQGDFIVGEVSSVQEHADLGTKAKANGNMSSLSPTNDLRWLKVTLVGMLLTTESGPKFKLGVSRYPYLDSDVLYPTRIDLDAIFDVTPGSDTESVLRSIALGQSAVFEDYSIRAKIDSLFGAHSAVLGNTGSGKSCTITSMLQTIMRKTNHAALGSTFLIFDVNGEYADALGALALNSDIEVKIFSLNDDQSSPFTEQSKLRLPHWFLNIEEWRLLLQARDGAQLPILRNAIRFAKIASDSSPGLSRIRNSIVATCIKAIMTSDQAGGAKMGRLRPLLTFFGTAELSTELITRYRIRDNYSNIDNLDQLLAEVENYILPDDQDQSLNSTEFFEFDKLREHLEFAMLYEEGRGNLQVRNHCAPMMTRYESFSWRKEFKFLTGTASDSIKNFVFDILGLSTEDGRVANRSQITIFDLNGLDDDVIEIFSSVVTRLIFETLQTAQPRNRLPVNLVLEEAHRYIPHENKHFPANKIFERVAKEGRKYGLFLLISSQRPSEISKTVLSQCNNFIVHRIQNPDDLFFIERMTPHVSAAVLRQLPYLPQQHALIFGQAVNLPSIFKVKEAKPRPKSLDSQVADCWYVPAGNTIDVSFRFDDTTIDDEAQVFPEDDQSDVPWEELYPEEFPPNIEQVTPLERDDTTDDDLPF